MKSLIIIDGYSLMYTSYFAGMHTELTSPSGEITSGTYIFVRTLLKILEQEDPDLLCVAVDGPGGNFRKDIYKDYKSNRRKEMPEGLLPQINRMKEILEAMSFPIYYVSGFEADDVIGTITQKAIEEGNLFVTICSKDKDLYQLLDKQLVEILDPYKNKTITSDKLVEKYGIEPFQFTDYLGFVGDPTDNIPGVKGIGPKTAAKLLLQFGTGEAIYENVSEIKETTKKKLVCGKDDFIMSKTLATLRMDIDMEINFKDMKRREFDWSKLNPIYEELGFESLMKIQFKNRELP